MTIRNYTFMVYSFLNPFSVNKYNQQLSKLEFQVSRISLFMTLQLPGAPRGSTTIFSTPTIMLTCTKWPNLNYQTIFGSIVIVISTRIQRESWAQIIAPRTWIGLNNLNGCWCCFQNNKALHYGLEIDFEILFMWETLA